MKFKLHNTILQNIFNEVYCNTENLNSETILLITDVVSNKDILSLIKENIENLNSENKSLHNKKNYILNRIKENSETQYISENRLPYIELDIRKIDSKIETYNFFLKLSQNNLEVKNK